MNACAQLGPNQGRVLEEFDVIFDVLFDAFWGVGLVLEIEMTKRLGSKGEGEKNIGGRWKGPT